MISYLSYFIWPIWNWAIIFLFSFPITVFFAHFFLRKKNISVIKKVWIYLFVLFFFLALGLILFPFPDFSPWFCESRKAVQTWQFQPFQFIEDIQTFAEKHQVWLLRNKALFQVIFNIFLIMPLWFILALVFRFWFFKIFFVWFLTSLFFEFTQWTALYWLLPCPYRFFDVDDLMLNTSWALLWFFVAFPFVKKFQRFMESKSFIVTNKNYLLLRIWAYFSDFMIICILFVFVFSIFFNLFSIWSPWFDAIFKQFIACFLYFVVFAYFMGWQTIWKKMFLLKIVDLEGKNPSIFKLFIRSIIPVFSFVIINFLSIIIDTKTWIIIGQSWIYPVLIFSYILIFIPLTIELSTDWRWLHEKISKTKLVRTKEKRSLNI